MSELKVNPSLDKDETGAASAPPSRLRDRVRSLQLKKIDERKTSVLPWVLGLMAIAGIGIGVYFGRDQIGAGISNFKDFARSGKSASTENAQSNSETSERAVSGESPRLPPGASPKAEITTTRAAADPSGLVLERKGYVIPAQKILVSPKVGGMLISLNAKEGTRVAKGDVLAQIENTEYQADYDRSAATAELMKQRWLELQKSRDEEIQQSLADWEEGQERLKELQSEFGRAKTLYEQRVLTKQEFDDADSAFKMQQKRVRRLEYGYNMLVSGPREERKAAAKAEWNQAEADMMKAKWRLDNSTIRAPVTGTILKKSAEEGNIVNAAAFQGSFSICEMADLSHLEIELDVAERDIAKVFPGQVCKVRIEAFADRVYEAVVDRIMPVGDRGKGAVPVRVRVIVPPEEEGVYVKPDMGAIVAFYGTAPANDKTNVSTTPSPKVQ